MKKIVNNSEIAILLGVYNGAKYIEEQIESILSQSFKNWTLYIRDDASNDNTLDILKKYESLYDNIVVIEDSDGNLGCNGNYFRLLSLIESKIYMFCNADDYWLPFKIELSYSRFILEESRFQGKPIVVHTDLTISDANLNVMENSYWESINTDPELFKSFNKLGLCSVVAGATMMFNNEVKNLSFPVADKAPFFDHWIALKVVGKGVISSIHKPTMLYRQIGTNLAAVSIGKQNSFLYKIKNLKKVFKINYKEAVMLKSIGWGGYGKYLIFKFIVFYMCRYGPKYKSGSFLFFSLIYNFL